MTNTYFFTNVDTNDKTENFINNLEEYAQSTSKQIYLIDSPLGEKKYSYDFQEGMILLIPDYKITIINAFGNESEYDDYYDDLLEDIGHLSDRFEYKKILGRPRKWKNDLVGRKSLEDFNGDIESFITDIYTNDEVEKRQIDLLISLLIGSINSIDKLDEQLPTTLLDQVKQNIILFDGDQTRFIFKKKKQKRITIQGLAGTGKTELLLHKIKELYTENDTNRIAFTCFNKSLANSLKSRVPAFFDFMKVEEQIKWDERLWIMHSWGSKNDPSNIGLYSHICKMYGIPFQGLNQGNFNLACMNAIAYIDDHGPFEPIFDYVLIDESQDFQESFIELCEKVTSNTVYVAGDIFQNIFQPNINETSPDFLLNKCYRTDPKTLMLAHSIGFGNFEEVGIRRLSNDQWEKCGYIIEENDGNRFVLSRTPLRKFTELDKEHIESVSLLKYNNLNEIVPNIISIIENIVTDHPTVKPDDIAIIITDRGNSYFDLMNYISSNISAKFNWPTNKLYDTKAVKKGSLSISNINNIKGLEFPFIICIADNSIGLNVRRRNALYMTLTRSFITSYLMINETNNGNFYNLLQTGYNSINSTNKLIFERPERYIDSAELVFDVTDQTISQRDIVDSIFEKYTISYIKQDKLRTIVQTICPDSVDYTQIENIIKSNMDLV